MAGLFEQYISECVGQADSTARTLFEEAQQAIMVQAPELDEMVRRSSVIASDR